MKSHLVAVLFASLVAIVVPDTLAVFAQSAGQEVTTKTVCISSLGYDSIDDMKAHLLLQAKREAASELFGELITAITSVNDSVVVQDVVTTNAVGYVRIQGDPLFRSGDDLAETCVTIRAYATEDDRAQFEPVPVSKPICLTEPDLTRREIAAKARAEAQIQALTDYDRQLQGLPLSEIGRLLKRVEFSDAGYQGDTDVYCLTLSAEIVPIEVQSYKALVTPTQGSRQVAVGSDSTLTPLPESSPTAAAVSGGEPAKPAREASNTSVWLTCLVVLVVVGLAIYGVVAMIRG